MNALKASYRRQTALHAVLDKFMAESAAYRAALARKITDPTKPNVHDNIDYKTALNALSAAQHDLGEAERASNAAKKGLEILKSKGGKRRTHRKRNHKRKCTRRH
jgi:hypothetical protein